MGIRKGEIVTRKKCLTLAVFGILLLNSACSSKEPPRWDEVARSTEYYHASSRTRAPEPVYGRMTWSHLPEPQVLKNKEDAPFLDPKFSFEMANSNLGEAIEALSQSIGYNWEYPKRLGSRKISINMVGTVSAILQEICKQARVRAELDNKERIIHVQDEGLSPKL